MYAKKAIARLSTFLLALGIGAAALGAPAAMAEEPLRIGGVIFGQHSSVRAVNEVFVPEVVEGTDGRYAPQLFTDGQLGGNQEIVQQTRNGTIFGALISIAWVTSYVPELSVSGLPFLFEDRETAFRVFDGPQGDLLRQKLEEKGFVLLGFMELGFRHLTNSVKPITSPDQLDGMKIRLQANPVHIATFEQLGANTAQVDGKELFSALRQGVVDGQENPYSVLSLFKLYEAEQKYLTETGHFYDALVFLASKRMLDAMEPADREAILAAGREATRLQREYEADDIAGYKQTLIDHGVQITTLTPEQRAAFVAKAQPVYDQVREELGAELVDGFTAAARSAD